MGQKNQTSTTDLWLVTKKKAWISWGTLFHSFCKKPFCNNKTHLMPSLQTAAGVGFGTINTVHTTAFGSRDTIREISSTSNTLKIEETVREIHSLQFLGNSHLNFGHKGSQTWKWSQPSTWSYQTLLYFSFMKCKKSSGSFFTSWFLTSLCSIRISKAR